jgi:glycosyltransferase involved in cell wall biosynthesis
VINIKEIIYPVTIRKTLWWAWTVSAVGGCIALEVTLNAFSIAANYNNWGLMGALYSVDIIVQTMVMVTAKYPAAATILPTASSPQTQETQDAYDGGFLTTDAETDKRAKNAEVAIIIPTHLSADKIEATLRTCLKHVAPHQIIVLDNGNSEHPLDNTGDIIRNVDWNIHYIWGHIGNKTLAQYFGAIFAKKYKYVFTIDDDMRLPENFSFGLHLLTDNVKAVCYPIRAVPPELAGCAKLSQDRFGGVLYPHGAGSLWDREIFIRVLEQHDAIFFADDIKQGMILTKMGYRMTIAAESSLDTEVPASLFGSDPNLYKQRVRSWDISRQIYFFLYVLQLFTVAVPSKSVIDKIVFKISQAYSVYSNIADWLRFPVFLILLTNSQYWMRLAILIAAGNIPVLLWNYVKLPLNHRSELKSCLIDLLTFPVFKLIENIFSVFALARLCTVFIPNYHRSPNVTLHQSEMIKDPQKLREDIEGFFEEVAVQKRELASRESHPRERRNSVIKKVEISTTDSPNTYKKCLYAQFFQPVFGYEAIEKDFEESRYMI